MLILASRLTLSQKATASSGPDGPSLSRPHAMLVAHGQWPPGDHGQRPLSSAPILNLPGSPSLGSILISSMRPVPGTVKAAFSERELPSKLKLAKLHEQIKGVFWFPFFFPALITS